MRAHEARQLIIGQEVRCSDGLGRVAEVVEGICNNVSIKVDTYIKNRSCVYDCYGVYLIPARFTDDEKDKHIAKLENKLAQAEAALRTCYNAAGGYMGLKTSDRQTKS
jgi:hypothetical protein